MLLCWEFKTEMGQQKKEKRFKKEQMMMLIIVFRLGENTGVSYHRRSLFLPDIFLSSLQISILAIPL